MAAILSENKTGNEYGNRKRVLITGGLGYIGSRLTRALAGGGHEVFVLSRGKGFSPAVGLMGEDGEDRETCKSGGGGEQSALPDLGAPYTFIAADLVEESPESLARKLPDQLDVCIHAAAAVDGTAPGYARESLLANGLGTRNMLEALCLRANMDGAGRSGAEEQGTAAATPQMPLFLYCSTFHIYGPLAGHITESSAPAPANDYALTHLFAEEYCRLFARASNLPCIILRLSNGYGAPLHAPFRQWNLIVNDLCRMAYETGRITLRANPEQERDFVWLGDVARVVEGLVARAPGCLVDMPGAWAGEQGKETARTAQCGEGCAPDVPVFNIASGLAVSLGEVAQLAARTAADFLRKEVVLEFAAPGHQHQEIYTPSEGISVSDPLVRPVTETPEADSQSRSVAWDELPDLLLSGTIAGGHPADEGGARHRQATISGSESPLSLEHGGTAEARTRRDAQSPCFSGAGLFESSVIQTEKERITAPVPGPSGHGLFVDNSAIRKAFPGLAFSSRMKEEMLAILEFLRLHECP